MTEEEGEKMVASLLQPFAREFEDICGFKVAPGLDYKRLAKNMIIVPVEVEHRKRGTAIYRRYDDGFRTLLPWMVIDGHHGAPGPDNIALILPLPKKEDKDVPK